MLWIVLGALGVSGLVPYLLVRGRVRRAPAWALGGLFVYLIVWSGMRFTIETIGGREIYGLNALAQAKQEGAIKEDVYQRERTRTTRAFTASILAAVATSVAYGVILRLSSKPKSA